MLIKIPPKHSIAEVIGYIKGKSAISVARQFSGRKRNFNGEKFGQGVMLYQQLALRRLRYVIISRTKSKLTDEAQTSLVNSNSWYKY